MKKLIFLLLLFPLFIFAKEQTTAIKPPGSKTICLNMIVKNEHKAIERCLASVKPLIDYWVIYDTGSTDGTQDLIRNALKDIPGELHESPWIDFAHNRNEALFAAYGKADYLLFIDADEQLSFPEGYVLPELTEDCYLAIVRSPEELEYERATLIKNASDWKWVGVLHENIESVNPKTFTTWKDVVNLSNTQDGYRYSDPQKYMKDALVLEKALETDPENTRYVFYLAQSYCNAKEYELSLKNYQKRASMQAGCPREIFWSQYCVGRLQELLARSQEEIMTSYCKAFELNQTRAEPIYHLANLCIRTEKYSIAYGLLRMGLEIPLPKDGMYVDRTIYDFGMLEAYGICSFLMGRVYEAKELMEKLLTLPKLPEEVQVRAKNNLECCRQRIQAYEQQQQALMVKAS